MILAHHGWGEEALFAATAGGAATLPALVLVWRARLAELRRWLRRR